MHPEPPRLSRPARPAAALAAVLLLGVSASASVVLDMPAPPSADAPAAAGAAEPAAETGTERAPAVGTVALHRYAATRSGPRNLRGALAGRRAHGAYGTRFAVWGAGFGPYPFYRGSGGYPFWGPVWGLGCGPAPLDRGVSFTGAGRVGFRFFRPFE